MHIPKNRNNKRLEAQIWGLAFDAKDGHKRITKGDNFQLHGGSEETHERMLETAIKVNEKLDMRGKTLNDVSQEELKDIFHDAADL